MKAITPREASIFAALADAVLAPAPPLPPIAETDAPGAFDDWLAHAPRPNRAAIRALLYAFELAPLAVGFKHRLRRLPRDRRRAAVKRIERLAGPAAEILRSSAALSYYGDPRVAARLGYRPPR